VGKDEVFFYGLIWFVLNGIAFLWSWILLKILEFLEKRKSGLWIFIWIFNLILFLIVLYSIFNNFDDFLEIFIPFLFSLGLFFLAIPYLLIFLLVWIIIFNLLNFFKIFKKLKKLGDDKYNGRILFFIFMNIFLFLISALFLLGILKVFWDYGWYSSWPEWWWYSALWYWLAILFLSVLVFIIQGVIFIFNRKLRKIWEDIKIDIWENNIVKLDEQVISERTVTTYSPKVFYIISAILILVALVLLWLFIFLNR